MDTAPFRCGLESLLDAENRLSAMLDHVNRGPRLVSLLERFQQRLTDRDYSSALRGPDVPGRREVDQAAHEVDSVPCQLQDRRRP